MNYSGIHTSFTMIGLYADQAVEIGGKGDEKRRDCCDGHVEKKGR